MYVLNTSIERNDLKLAIAAVLATLVCAFALDSNAQTADPVLVSAAALADRANSFDHPKLIDLALTRLINATTRVHPAVEVERIQSKASEEDLEAAKLLRYPNFSASAQTDRARLGTVFGADVPLWNAGRIRAQIGAAQASVQVQDAKTIEVQQNLALRVVDAWQTARVAQEKLVVLNYTKAKLELLRAMMARRVEAQVSPSIEGELVTTRLLQIQSDEAIANSALVLGLKKLTQLSGEKVQGQDLVTEQSNQAFGALALEPALLTQYAQEAQLSEQHPSIERAKKVAQVSLRESEVRAAARFPEVYLRVQRQDTALGTKANSAFIGFRYETGAGLSSSAVARSASERALALEKSIETVRSELSENFESERETLRTNLARANSLGSVVASSRLVLDSYERLFIAGRRTWQEVMTALRESNDYQVSLAESRIQTVASAWRLRIRSTTSFNRGIFEN